MLYFKITLLFAHMDLTMLQVVGNHDLDFWAILLKSHSRTWKRWITWKKFTSLPDGLGQFTHATIPSSTTHVIHEPCIRPCSPRVLRSSVVRASDRCRKGHRFNSCWGLRFFLCPVHVKCWSYYSRGSFYWRAWLHDTGATFAPARVHSGSLSWLYICLHDTTTTCHAGASYPGVNSSRRLRYESQRYHVNAKRPPVSVWNRSAGGLEQVAPT